MASISDWRLIKRDPVTGIEEWWRWNGDGTCTIRRTQDVEGTLDRNVAAQNHNDGWDKQKEMRRVASIPLILLDEWRLKGFDYMKADQKERAKVLNDPDYRKLRTALWRV